MVFFNLETTPVTRWLFVASSGLGVLVAAELLTEEQLYFSPRRVFGKGEVWRIATSLLYLGKCDLSLVMRMIALVQYSSTLEANVFVGCPEDYVIFIAFGAVLFVGLAGFVYVPFLSSCLVSYFLYYWSKHFGDQRVQITSLPFVVPAMYMPVICVLVSALTGVIPLLQTLLGFAAAHAYFFLRDVIAIRYNIALLRAPEWFLRAARPIYSRT